MSTDLSYPLVTSMGHHDPLDGLVTYLESQSLANLNSDSSFPDLHQEIADIQDLCKAKEWATHDPLGLGGLLFDSFRLVQLFVMGNKSFMYLLHDTLEDTGKGLAFYAKSNHLKISAQYRLAFRELGLAIGLKAISRMENFMKDHSKTFMPIDQWELMIESLKEYLNLIDLIQKFWVLPENQESDSWKEHKNINIVMLCTCLSPDGFLSI